MSGRWLGRADMERIGPTIERGTRVNDCGPRLGSVLRNVGHWQVKVLWDDGAIEELHIEDVGFE